MRNNRTLLIIISIVLITGYFSYSSYALNTEDFNSKLISKIAISIWFLMVIIGLSNKSLRKVK
jgi:hypothetical protein